jgi:hypothetical protein
LERGVQNIAVAGLVKLEVVFLLAIRLDKALRNLIYSLNHSVFNTFFKQHHITSLIDGVKCILFNPIGFLIEFMVKFRSDLYDHF